MSRSETDHGTIRWIGLIIVLVALGTAVFTAASRAVVRGDGSPLSFETTITPKSLPRYEMEPIDLGIRAEVPRGFGNTQPPPLRRLIVDFDKDLSIDAKDLKICRRSWLDVQTIQRARKSCADALVGTGVAHIGVEASSRGPIEIPLAIFNANVGHGRDGLYVYGPLGEAQSGPMIGTVTFQALSNNRYALRAEFRFPEIAGGKGSLLDFEFGMGRRESRHDSLRTYATARCADGKQSWRVVEVAFATGETYPGEASSQTCIPSA
jgi:hypothetical protein